MKEKGYKDATALRRALEARLKRQSDSDGTDLGRLRRRVVFDRLAARLSADPDGEWILKGGAALEFRLRNRARATKDLDLAVRATDLDGDAIRDALLDAVGEDPDGDWFTFRIAPPVALAADAAGRPAWRFSVEAGLAGKPFAGIRLDVAARAEELAATEPLALLGVLEFAGIPARTIEAVDRRQHFAEKLHAFSRDYGDRPNTRVKDLADLVLLIETGLVPDRELYDVVEHVFTVRATHPLPSALPDPPPLWRETYPSLADGLTETTPSLDAALALLRVFWDKAVADTTGTEL
ncbi:nucleotidyl transferase AbiEii/AbiGii toxin family protein [Streptomyces sp. AM 4-1-1]|uniref:nucleotidyl transferase AbiEii/AbiGii toxin family protein n=1 Tax=unclassified Streptomyces TaxID=2593676 RepID=UPI0023B9296D|nr:nucleotidyl transferase AbiEii/AbiGii toxin family protein [Streptomyces sp. AM 4-1-1]WEH33251.1 nucleotidyl transferase AbiEii/AbiGii toxin family protein [Streptomyces sp. AM 4-1-1]